MISILWTVERIINECLGACSVLVSKELGYNTQVVVVKLQVNEGGKFRPSFTVDEKVLEKWDKNKIASIASIVYNIWVKEIAPLLVVRLSTVNEVHCSGCS